MQKAVRLAFDMMCYNTLGCEITVRSFLVKWSNEKEKLERDFQKELKKNDIFFENEVNCECLDSQAGLLLIEDTVKPVVVMQ